VPVVQSFPTYADYVAARTREAYFADYEAMLAPIREAAVAAWQEWENRRVALRDSVYNAAHAAMEGR
jgi:hypothetical protein